jgi:uncharacterized radical SAM superfamily Fe-S cluster-containing enzyme
MTTVLGQSLGTCPVCGRLSPVRQTASDGQVRQRSFCPDHGEHERTIHSDTTRFLAEEHFVKPAWIPREHGGEAALSCPDGCGHCERHEQHLCMPFIEITDRCDLACPICIADAAGPTGHDVDEATFGYMLDRLLAAEGQVDILNLSGGEPLLHPRLLALVDAAIARPEIVRVSIATNGLTLLERPELVRELAARRVTISLQCDGLDDTVTRRLRGRPLADAKRRILDLLGESGCSTSLVMTAARGINDDRFRELVDLLFTRNHIVSLMIQPLAHAGRAAALPRGDDPLDVAACIRLLGACGHPALGEDAFVPLPCSHPRCFSLAFFLMAADGTPVPVARLVEAERLLDTVANRTVFGLDPDEFRTMQSLLYDLWSGPLGQAPDVRSALDAVRGLLRRVSSCSFDARSVFAASERAVKSIFVHGFQDRHTFDLARLRRCCNAYVQPDGRLMPACAHNVLDGRRARMAMPRISDTATP